MLQKYQVQILEKFWKNCIADALDALSSMIRKEVKPFDYSIRIEPINNIPKLMSPQELSTTLVYTTVEDKLKCTIVFLSTLNHFLRLIDILLNKKIDYYDALNDENESVVVELGNIINGYFLSSLNSLFNCKLNYRKTELSINPYRAIEDFELGDLYKKKVNVLMFKADFKVKDEDIEGKLFLLTEEGNTDTLLEAISDKMKI